LNRVEISVKPNLPTKAPAMIRAIHTDSGVNLGASIQGSFVIRLAIFILAGAALVLAAGCSAILQPIEQRYLFRPWNPPSTAYLASVVSRGDGIEEIRLKTPDGVALHGWLKRPQAYRGGERFPLVIVFGGARRETSWMIERGEKPERWGWLYVNYRGFGLSEGQPSEQVVLQDARLIYDYAVSRPDVDTANIVGLGRSLGTYFAVALANKRPLRGVILATPFDSIAALGKERFPWLPTGLILAGRYDAAAIAPSINVPALIVLAENDDITPTERGVALARAWGGPQRTMTLMGARHYGIERRDEFWKAVREFLGEIDSAGSLSKGYAKDPDFRR
jgi:uncharacterized protein